MGRIIFKQGRMAGRAGDCGQAQCRAVERGLGVDHAGITPGPAILSGDPRGRPGGKMAHGEEPEGLHQDGRQAAGAEDGAGEGRQR